MLPFFMITVVRALTDVETPTIVRTSWESSTTIFRTATLPTLWLAGNGSSVPTLQVGILTHIVARLVYADNNEGLLNYG